MDKIPVTKEFYDKYKEAVNKDIKRIKKEKEELKEKIDSLLMDFEKRNKIRCIYNYLADIGELTLLIDLDTLYEQYLHCPMKDL